jgi:hypothetical protein
MKQLILILIVAAALFLSDGKQSSGIGDTVNPVIGDISFVTKFGKLPDASTDEDLRIKTHLEYVEDLLRKKDITEMNEEQKEKRSQLLDLLHEYRTAGIFPRNYDHPGKRIPCFIDKDGNICAVGYLIEQTAGREAADEINSKYKYEELLAMNDATVDSWIISSGLTKEECAMIQPAYGDEENNNDIPPGYGISSVALGGVNITLNALNLIQIISGANSKIIPVISLLTGAGSIVLGAANLEDDVNGGFTGHHNKSKKTLSIANIGLGAVSMILGAWNLIESRPKEHKALNWNLYSFPTKDKQFGFGVNVSKKF